MFIYNNNKVERREKLRKKENKLVDKIEIDADGQENIFDHTK